MILRRILDSDATVLIAGPTASGKSSLALKLAVQTNGVVVNADALQVYNCWHVLTARPEAGDTAKAPHELYGHISRTTRYSVGAWLKDIARVKSEYPGRRLIIVGGTGLYFTSLTKGLAAIPDVSHEIRDLAQMRIDTGNIAELLEELRTNDPETLSRIDVKNPVRVQRAWEVWRETGVGLAAWHDKESTPLLPPGETIPIVINAPKERLNPRIELRFAAMLTSGALDECRAALKDWDPTRPSSRAIGARELIGYLQGHTDLETATQAAETATRQYAKRQRSWFRSNMKSWNTVNMAQDGIGWHFN